MKRREVITLLGGAAAWWPLAARAQQPTMPVVGFLRSTSIERSPHLVAAFLQGLKETGYFEGQNVAIAYRSAEGQYDRLTALAADLVQRRVDIIVATGGSEPARAAKAATSTIPIIFTAGPDPVRDGLVASLNQPGGNLTGISLLSYEIGSKRVGLLRELIPNATTIAVLLNRGRPVWQTCRACARTDAHDRPHWFVSKCHQCGSCSAARCRNGRFETFDPHRFG